MSGIEQTPIVPVLSMTLAILIASLLLAAYLSRPLRELRWALDRFAQGHLDTRLKGRMGSRRDEVADLAMDFDKMAERVERLTNSRELLFHGASHELRSPLHRLQTAVGLLKQDSSEVVALVDRIEKEGNCLGKLVDELLMLHRLSARPEYHDRASVDVIELLEAIATDADFEARALGKKVVLDGLKTFVAEVDGELIYRACENVIRNAVKFTAIGSAVLVKSSIGPGGEGLTVAVLDRGPGVPPDKLEDIFEAFFRLEVKDTPSGAGLGLAIAKRAILLHGGRISASPREGGGLVVSFSVPRGVATAPAAATV